MLKVGLHLPHWTSGLAGRTPSWRDILAIARDAEAAGLDSLWVSDDLLLRFDANATLGMWEGWSCLAALAATTERVELGTLVVSANFRNPALLAKMADTVDEISGGRLILGIGAGGDRGEHRAFGFEWDQRFQRFEEALQVIRGLFNRERVTFDGRHHRARNCEILPRGPRPNGPPLMVGTIEPGPRMLRLAAQYGDLVNLWQAFGESSAEQAGRVRRALEDACLAHGRGSPPPGMTATVGLATSAGPVEFGPWDISAGALRGTPEEVAAQLRAYEAAGVSHLQVYVAPHAGPALDLLARATALARTYGDTAPSP
ncbi:MAG: LLM class flavin-dependent oxidoreductase [Dehalococcoidia bacterium]|nr:LLM class flavin-dependent oxidoreductase [Dehalococcoidia bacterium]